VACRRIVRGKKIEQEVRRFASTTEGLFAQADWLEDGKVTHVAMEATGVYWKPV
jgi:transposase